MPRVLQAGLPVLLLLVSCSDQTGPERPNVAGEYIYVGTISGQSTTLSGTLTLSEYAGALSGTHEVSYVDRGQSLFPLKAQSGIEGRVQSDGTIAWTEYGRIELDEWHLYELNHVGRLVGTTLTGEWAIIWSNGRTDMGTFTASRTP